MASDTSKDVVEIQPIIKQEATPSVFGSILGTEMVDVFVGKDLKHTKVHKKLLCDNVPYFDKMLSGSFKEAIENTIRLPEDDPRAFDLFLDWLYGGGAFRANHFSGDKSTPFERMDYCRLYCFADKLCMENLMDCAMTSYFSTLLRGDTCPSKCEMPYAYQNTKTGSPLRKLCVDSYIYIVSKGFDSWPLDVLVEILSSSNDFLTDYLRQTLANKGEKSALTWPMNNTPCTYHLHSKDKACPYKDIIP